MDGIRGELEAVPSRRERLVTWASATTLGARRSRNWQLPLLCRGTKGRPVFESDPHEWEFNAGDRQDYGGRFFKLPSLWVETGALRASWALSRGYGAAISMLPVLALETFPGKEKDAAGLDGAKGLPTANASEWTPFSYLSIRRIARLSGIDENTVLNSGFPQIEKLGWGQSFAVRCRKSANGQRRYFRLSTGAFAQKSAGFVAIHGSLPYGGIWPLLPPAAKQLYIAIGALDPVYDEEAFRESLDNDELADERIAELREREPTSIGELQRVSGLSHSTIHEAIKVLTHGLFAAKDTRRTLSLVNRGERKHHHQPTWYSREERIWKDGWGWNPDHLNRRSIAALRREQWPVLQERHREQLRKRVQKKRRAETGRKKARKKESLSW